MFRACDGASRFKTTGAGADNPNAGIC